MPTRGDKHPHQAVEETCEVISLADYLSSQIAIRRHKELHEVVVRLRQHAERANGHICRAWLHNDHLNDLDPTPLDAA